MYQNYHNFIKLILFGTGPYAKIKVPKAQTNAVFKIYTDAMSIKYFSEYGIELSYSFVDGILTIIKEPKLTKELTNRFPKINTFGTLLFVLKHPQLFKDYERPKVQFKKIEDSIDEGGDIE